MPAAYYVSWLPRPAQPALRSASQSNRAGRRRAHSGAPVRRRGRGSRRDDRLRTAERFATSGRAPVEARPSAACDRRVPRGTSRRESAAAGPPDPGAALGSQADAPTFPSVAPTRPRAAGVGRTRPPDLLVGVTCSVTRALFRGARLIAEWLFGARCPPGCWTRESNPQLPVYQTGALSIELVHRRLQRRVSPRRSDAVSRHAVG
jgi:hypothetical protein